MCRQQYTSKYFLSNANIFILCSAGLIKTKKNKHYTELKIQLHNFNISKMKKKYEINIDIERNRYITQQN